MMHELMPENAARYGVKPPTRMPISSASGMSVGQRSRERLRAGRGSSSSAQSAQPVRLASKCTCMNTPKKCMNAGTIAATMIVWYGDVEELDHQERRGAQHRRRDLPAGRRCGLDGAGEVARIAEADHRGNRQRADRDRVGDRRARQHAEQRRREHATPSPVRPRNGRRSTTRCRGRAARGRCASRARRTARSGRRRSRRRRRRCRRCPGSSGTGD